MGSVDLGLLRKAIRDLPALTAALASDATKPSREIGQRVRTALEANAAVQEALAEDDETGDLMLGKLAADWSKRYPAFDAAWTARSAGADAALWEKYVETAAPSPIASPAVSPSTQPSQPQPPIEPFELEARPGAEEAPESQYTELPGGMLAQQEPEEDNALEQALAEERLRAIQGLQSDMQGINMMFREMAGHTQEQGEMLTKIDADVETGLLGTKGAEKELRIARSYGARRTKLYALLLTGALGTLIGTSVWASSKLRDH